MKLQQCGSKRGIQGIHRSITLSGLFQITMTIADRNRSHAGRGGSGFIPTETAVISLELEERGMAAQFLADQQFQRGIGRLELKALGLERLDSFQHTEHGGIILGER